MFKIMKVETSYTQDVGSPSYEADMLDPSNYQPHILYLSKIDASYWWHSERRAALAFTTLREATAIVAAYRAHSGDRHSRIQVIETGERKAMPKTEDDLPEAGWTGRPQDDPRHIKAVRAEIARRRAENPPVNCWIASVRTIDLYLDGRHRARVLPDSALALLFDSDGGAAGSFSFLRSECPFAAVENRMGIGRLPEVRDESDEGAGEITPRPRQESESAARAFREQCAPAEEAGRYLRDAIGTYEFFGGAALDQGRAWRKEIESVLAAIARDDRKAALVVAQNALVGMRKESVLDWHAAWVDCSRAIEALRRDLEQDGDVSQQAPGTERRG